MKIEGNTPKISDSLIDAERHFAEKYNLTSKEICQLAVGLYNAEVLSEKLGDIHKSICRIETKIDNLKK